MAPAARRYRFRPFDGRLAALDRVLLLAALGLAFLGLVMVASASVTIGDRNFGAPLHYFWKQALTFSISVVLSVFLVRPGLVAWERAGGPLLVACIAMLALILVPGLGRTVNGATRWLPLGFWNLQPSELMKLGVVVYVAGYLVRRADEVRSSLWGFVKPVALLSIIGVLLLLEPDYGTTVVLVATVLVLLFLGGVPWPTYLAWVAVIGAGLVLLAVAAPYRLQRLMSFWDPWGDPYASGFQLTQALIAIGRGTWTGVGLGGSVQKLFYLPEAHTDFLFAVLGEELGFVGMTVVIGLFLIVIWRAFQIGARAERAGKTFAANLAYGIGLMLGLQAFINIGVNLGVLPTKGLALPLMSYGGNSLAINVLAIALLLRASYESPEAAAAGPVGSPGERRDAPGGHVQ